MIDASRSPRPLWRRILTALLLVGGIVAAAWLIWVHELHHTGPHVGALPAVQPIHAISSLGRITA